MNSIAKAVLSGAVMGAILGLGAGGTAAQSLKQQIVGTWQVQSATVDQNGKKVQPFGPHPTGYWIFTAGGNFVSDIVRPDLPKFASNNRMKGTIRENRAVVQGSLSFFGTYTVNDADHSLTVRYVGSSFPNWMGTEQKRSVEISGDQLTYKNPHGTIGGASVVLVMKRIE
jgi:hypothetical protein